VSASLGSIKQARAHLAGSALRAATLAVAAVLAACAAQPPPAPPVAEKPRPIVQPRPQAAHRVLPAPKRKPAAPETAAGSPAEAKADAPPEPDEVVTASAATVPSTADLIGLDQQRATTLLGSASAIDTRSPATVWHYRAAQC